jgi:predicted nucleotidyltransferase
MEERHLEIVQDILNKYPYTFYAFGSRVKGTHKRFSDLDLCIKDPIPLRVKGQIDEDF